VDKLKVMTPGLDSLSLTIRKPANCTPGRLRLSLAKAAVIIINVIAIKLVTSSG
jgi:hypothetical protein